MKRQWFLYEREGAWRVGPESASDPVYLDDSWRLMAVLLPEGGLKTNSRFAAFVPTARLVLAALQAAGEIPPDCPKWWEENHGG